MSTKPASPAFITTPSGSADRYFQALGIPNPLILSPYEAILLYERYKAGELDRPVTDETDCELIQRLCAFFTDGDGREHLAVAQ